MIKQYIPKIVKQYLKRLPIRFTKNQRYDYFTKKIIQQHLAANSNCIDIGCFEGEILDLFLTICKAGNHFAFEPIPEKYQQLKQKYQTHPRVQLFNLALSNESGQSTFNYVTSNPSYSGLKKRDYDNPNEVETQITVETNRLDAIIPIATKIDCIKIDVEGAEFLVLQGSKDLIKKWKPLIIFEHGLGAADKYGHGPLAVYELLHACGLQISNLSSFLKNEKPLSKQGFEQQYLNSIHYYFIAHP